MEFFLVQLSERLVILQERSKTVHKDELRVLEMFLKRRLQGGGEGEANTLLEKPNNIYIKNSNCQPASLEQERVSLPLSQQCWAQRYLCRAAIKLLITMYTYSGKLGEKNLTTKIHCCTQNPKDSEADEERRRNDRGGVLRELEEE